MRFLRYFSVSETNGYVDHEKLEGLEIRIQFMADNLKLLLTTLYRHNTLWHSFFSLPAIIEEINRINVKVTEMRFMNLAPRSCSVVKYLPAQHSNPVTVEEMVDFGNDKDKMIQYLARAMQLSYDNLPDHIRPCFLYIGMFPEDARISVSKLISLWIAEGFMQNIESGRLMEEVAERYLMDLIHSNMSVKGKHVLTPPTYDS
ncbi:hypothetical protein BC332_18187 [Capsicum chinense]|nr:hypothetical protein BC332_18187 [Capsicum chinense]